MELRPSALARRLGSTTRPAITATVRTRSRPLLRRRRQRERALDVEFARDGEDRSGAEDEDDVAWLRKCPARPKSVDEYAAGTIVNRVGSVHARNRKPTAVAEPVSVRIVHDRAVWNSQT